MTKILGRETYEKLKRERQGMMTINVVFWICHVSAPLSLPFLRTICRNQCIALFIGHKNFHIRLFCCFYFICFMLVAFQLLPVRYDYKGQAHQRSFEDFVSSFIRHHSLFFVFLFRNHEHNKNVVMCYEN